MHELDFIHCVVHTELLIQLQKSCRLLLSFPLQDYTESAYMKYPYMFFLKHLGALGSHVRFQAPTLTGLNAGEVARVVSERTILRHSHHTCTHTHSHTQASAPGGKIPRQATLERGIGGLHTWSAHHPSYRSVPIPIYVTELVITEAGWLQLRTPKPV